MPEHSRSERPARYRYETTIRVVIDADGQDIAWRIAREAAEAARVAGVKSADTSMLDLRYRPTEKDQRTQPPEPVGADRELTPRGPSGDSVSFPLTNTVEDEERASWADREPDDPPS